MFMAWLFNTDLRTAEKRFTRSLRPLPGLKWATYLAGVVLR